MKLTMICEGLAANPPRVTAIDVANFSQILNAAGSNTQITLSNAQGRPIAELAPVIQSAGSRNLELQIDGLRASESQAVEIINSSIGPNTSVEISSINSFTQQAISNVVTAAAGKKISVKVNCATASEAQAVFVANAVRDTSIELGFLALNALPSQSIPAVFTAVGSKEISAEINALTSTVDQAKNVIANATPATKLSLVNAEALGYEGVAQIVQTVGAREFGISVNAESMTINDLNNLAQITNPNTSLSLSMAHAIAAGNISNLIALSAGKKLSFSMSGQTSTQDQLRAAVTNANGSTSTSIDTAHAVMLSVMLDLISTSANKDLSLTYNGSQLVVTPTDGNYVVRALQVAKPTTSITVNSIGVTNFSLQHTLEIVQAAG
ncbi:hypothetical protein [Pseudomonas oryzihabitans]|uniref:hypothetical protein n=1 Tax=Pseudomonas oryzihabitans TaxID=47885 RepID=UPI0015E434B1|nr:hypothetical protein [Pseudomonas psychrotolerans]MBA1211158.1 hypothetical protein [Pseudomonas psychrotolerans]